MLGMIERLNQIGIAAAIVIIASCSTSTFKGSSSTATSSGSSSGPGTSGCAADDTICFQSNGKECAATDASCIAAGGNPQSADTDPLKPGKTSGSGGSGGPGQGGAVQCDENGKKSISWTGPAKDCIEGQKKMFHFGTSTCMTMPQAKFECNWEKLTAELLSRDLLTAKLSAGSTDGSVLVSCGQSQDGNKIVVQWIKVTSDKPAPACGASISEEFITTGCYQQFGSGQALPDVSSPEKERAYVYGCLNSL